MRDGDGMSRQSRSCSWVADEGKKEGLFEPRQRSLLPPLFRTLRPSVLGILDYQ